MKFWTQPDRGWDTRRNIGFDDKLIKKTSNMESDFDTFIIQGINLIECC